MDNLKKEIEKILSDNQNDWEPRFNRYYEKIINNEANIDKYRKQFHMRGFLRAYMNFGQAMKMTPMFSIRYGGQIIGLIKFIKNKKGPILEITGGQAESNNKWFQFDLPKGKYEWKTSDGAREFRKRFEQTPPPKVGQDEHRFETFLLDEMFNPTNKKFCGTFKNIQPVCIANNIPFQMPLPIRARGGKLAYKDGHVDIIARYGKEGPSLLVIEIKRPGGEYKNAKKQVYIYAVTLSYMFKKAGDDLRKNLFKLCKYKKAYPNLKFHAVVAFPPTYAKNFFQELASFSPSRVPNSIPIDHIIYELKDNQRIQVIKTSL